MTDTPRVRPTAVEYASPEDFRREAVRLLEKARNPYGDFDPVHSEPTANLAAAHVYATLAVAGEVADLAACIERYVGGVR